MLVRVQRVSVTRCRSQRPLPEVEHIVGAGTEGQQAFDAVTQGSCLRPSGEKLKAPIDRRSCGEESLTYRLNQRRIAHMRGFSEQAGGQVPLGVDGKQLVDFTYVALDEICCRLDTLRSDVLASGHQVEDEIVDQRLNRY